MGNFSPYPNTSVNTDMFFPMDTYGKSTQTSPNTYGARDAQTLIDSLLNMGVPQVPNVPGMGVDSPVMQPMLQPILPSGNWFDSLKGFGGKAVSSFMPKIDAETGKMQTMGWGMPALQGLSSLGNLYLGMKNYGLAKDQLRTQKDQFNRNYENQKQLLNTRMEDIQRTEAGGSSKAESVESYMARNRIK